MAGYISSNANRFYAAIEAEYGQAAGVGPNQRFPAVQLRAQQFLERGKRLDKTGTRTFLGASKDARRQTAFQTRTYLTSWSGSGEPSYGCLFQGALGSQGILASGLVIASSASATEMQTSTPHGLSPGLAVAYANEIRFVTGTPDAATITVNAPFSSIPPAGAALAPTITYTLSTSLPSVTLYDYWDPGAVSRIVTGAAMDTLHISVNGDFHQFTFSGPAADLLDSSSFVAGTAGLAAFPTEPPLAAFDYSLVPGHLGQAWLGSATNQSFGLTEASVSLKNHIETRSREFGTSYPRAIAPGVREVTSLFTVFAQDDGQTAALYAAAKRRDLIPAMLQLGQQQGQLMGIFLPSVTPEVPEFDDSETRLQWRFRNNLAQGSSNDEIYIAFA